MWQTILDNPSALAAIASAFCAVLVFLAGLIWQTKAAERLAFLGLAIDAAYISTKWLSEFTATKVDDKAAEALGYLRDEMRRRGYKLTLADELAARLAWTGKHTAEKIAEEGGALAARAALEAAAKSGGLLPPQ